MGFKQYLLGAVMVLIAIIGIVAGGEILVRFTAPQNLNGTWLKVGPRGLRINKAGGTAQHQLGARVVRYNFNSLHQRGAEPGKDGIRVLVLGDSFTFGWLVGEDKSFVGRLQIMADRRFGPRRIRFLNAGTGGWGTTDALAYLEWMGPKIAPDAVLVMLNFDDISRNRRRNLYRLRPNRGLELEAGSVEVPGVALKRWVHRFVPGYQWLLEHSHLFQLLRRTVIVVFNLDTPPTSAEIPPEFMAAIDAFPGAGRRCRRRSRKYNRRQWTGRRYRDSQ